MLTVWFFLIVGSGTATPCPQLVDHFPSEAACEQFRENVQGYLDAFGSGAATVRCQARPVVGLE